MVGGKKARLFRRALVTNNDYNTSNNSANLNADQIENKAALFGIVNYGRVLYGA